MKQEIKDECLEEKIIECEFCYQNYQVYKCQFYRPHKSEFSNKNRPNGELIFCECCDESDGGKNESEDCKRAKLEEKSGNTTAEETQTNPDLLEAREPTARVQAGWYGKGYRKTIKKKKRNNQS